MSIIPLFAVDLPPLVDLYGHLGRYAIQTELAVRPQLQPFFTFDWILIGNLGADFIVEALHPVFGLEGAVRVGLIGIQILACGGILALSREVHGRITPFAVAALPLIYGLPFSYGFINYAFSMALALLAFAVWLRLRRLGRDRLAAFWLLLVGSPIWVVHTYGWAFLCLLCGAAMIADVIDSRNRLVKGAVRILAACGPLLVPLVFMVLWRAHAGASYAGGWSLALKLVWLASVFRNQWVVPDLISATFLFMLVYWAIRERDVTWDARLGIAAAMALASYLALPMFVMGSAYADMRLVPYMLALALLAISPAQLPARKMRYLTLAVCVFLALRTIAVGCSYFAQDKLVEQHLATLEPVSAGSRLAVLVIKPCTLPWELPVTDHIGSLAMVRKNIFANDQWEGPGVNPLRVTYPAGGAFVRDPSQIVQADGCQPQAAPYLSESLKAIPRTAFTHVWIIGETPPGMPEPAGLELLAHRGKGRLYRVRPAPAALR